MWDFVQLGRGSNLLLAPIVHVQEVDGFLNIAYDNPAFYFKGTIRLKLEPSVTASTGVFEVTLDEPSSIHDMLITGHTEREPGLIYFEGTYCRLDEPTKPWDIVIQCMPLHELADEAVARRTVHEDQ